MKKQHTPGPWIACSGNAGEKFNIESKRYGNDLLPVATLRGPDRKANAQLIAAAPMLAEALKALLEDYVSTLSAYNEYRECTDGMSAVPEDDSAIQARAALAAAGVLS